MTEQLFLATITATAEIRDVDGNLISSQPVKSTHELTAAQVRELTEGEPE